MELYLCLTRPLKSGTAYVGDLRGDAARRNGSIDPPAQCRYLRFPEVGQVALSTATGMTYRPAAGIAAYLAARVAPGGAGDPVMTIAVTGVVTGDTVTIGALVFTAGTKEDAPTKTWKDSATAGSDAASAASLAAILQDPTILPSLITALGVTRAAVTATTNVVSITTDPPTSPTPTVASDPTHTAISALAVPAVVPPSDGYDKAAQSIVARLAVASSMTVKDVNTVLSGFLGGASDLVASGGSLSDLLSILAGRAFQLGVSTPLFDPTSKAWLGGPHVGTFERGLKLSDYWIFPAHPGPMTSLDATPSEIGPVRRTFPGSVFDSSVLRGQLSRLTNSIAIPGARGTQGRVVVVYDQDGNVVA